PAFQRSTAACAFIQSCGVVPKASASDSAVSAVTPTLPEMMLLIFAGVQPRCRANCNCEIPPGSRNNSLRISPGVVGGRCFGILMVALRSMIVGDFNIFGSLAGRSECDSPLPVDSNAVLSAQITSKRLQPISR